MCGRYDNIAREAHTSTPIRAWLSPNAGNVLLKARAEEKAHALDALEDSPEATARSPDCGIASTGRGMEAQLRTCTAGIRRCTAVE
jgi:hypothetical protein